MGTKYSKYRAAIDVSKAIDNETNDAKSKPPSISSQEKEKNGAFHLDPDGNESSKSRLLVLTQGKKRTSLLIYDRRFIVLESPKVCFELLEAWIFKC